MSWVFSSSGCAATYRTLPSSRNPRSSRKASWAVIGSAARPPEIGPASTAPARRSGTSRQAARCDPCERRGADMGDPRSWEVHRGRTTGPRWKSATSAGLPASLLHGERDRVLRLLPHHLEHAPATGLRLDRHRELVDRLVEGRLLEVHPRQLVLLLLRLVIGDAPLAGLLVDDELGGAVLVRDGEQRVRAGGERVAADLDRLRGRQQGRLVGAGAPDLAVGDQPAPDLAGLGRPGLGGVGAPVDELDLVAVDRGRDRLVRADALTLPSSWRSGPTRASR